MPALKGKFEFRKSPRTTRRSLLFALGYCLMLSTTLSSCSEAKNNAQQPAASPESVAVSSTTEKQVVRIVRSKQLSALAVLEKQGSLEKRLEPLGFKVQWAEFAAGPQQLEALNANGLDIASTAESPPVFSQAAGAPLVYLATTRPSGKAISLLVPVNSSIKSVTDLKGKKVAFQKASIGHYLLVKALEDAGLKLSDVQSVFLAPADANAAFSQNKVDAWYIWEPFGTRNVQNKIARVLADGDKLRDTGNFYSTSRQFYQAHPDVIKVFLEELEKSEIWTKDHPKEVAQLLAPVTQLDPPTLEIMHNKYDYGLLPITEKTITKQQEVADKWYSLGLIPKKVNVRDGFLTPEEYAKITPSDVLANK
ncbi:aliphatic sulfonate ABC transporter substrate-binding protein [Nostoc punctiforme UO1]|uniref:aliphatic sulfonate ABC transporter substrate-binding protein n=1 Tax=Nostoc punctiforme TaxID=272131 RepID=UPI0030A4918D